MKVVKTDIWQNQAIELQFFMEERGYRNFRLSIDPHVCRVLIGFECEADALSFKLNDDETKFINSPPERSIVAEWRYDPDILVDIENALDSFDEREDYTFERFSKG